MARFTGTFLDIVHPSARDGVYWNRKTIAFTEEDWHALIAHLHDDFGLKQLVILNVSAPNGAFLFPCPSFTGEGWAPRFPTQCDDPVGAILRTAAKFGMTVFLGLGVAPAVETSGSVPEPTGAMLSWHVNLYQALEQRYGHLTSFAGIYACAEPRFGDNGLLPPAQVEWLRALSAALRPHLKGKPLLCCPFHHWKILAAQPDPGDLAAQIRKTGIDIFCPQDGVGFTTERDPRPATRSYEAAKILRTACQTAKVEFWYIIEVFSFENGVHFQPLLPATWRRIREQLELATTLSDTLIAYQIPGLMTSQHLFPNLGDPSSEILFQAYRKNLLSQSVPAS